MKNKIIEEWLVRDNLHLIQQLGLDAVEEAKKNSKYDGVEIPQKPIHDFVKVENEQTKLSETERKILSFYHEVLRDGHDERLDNFYHQEAVLHAICDKDIKGIPNIKAYLNNLIACLPKKEINVCKVSSNVRDGIAEVAVRWRLIGEHLGNGFFGEATEKPIYMPVINHYRVQHDKIVEEWMVFDAFDTYCQIFSS